MTTIDHASRRTSPSQLKKTASRAQHPALLSRINSTPRLGSKLVKGHKAGTEAGVDKGEDKDEDKDMATSFLQFCAMCEKQIVVPNNSILYCSENCRRMDGCKLPSENPYVTIYNDTSPPYSPELDDPFGVKSRDVVPRRQPTARPASLRIPPQLHAAKSDLDPTEWKPKLDHRPASDAFKYLSQFHRSTSSLTAPGRSTLGSRGIHPMQMANTAPSLSHTPTTSTASSEGSMAGTPYEFVGGPLAARHDAAVPFAAAATKCIDLVLPVVSTCNGTSVPSSSTTIKPKTSTTVSDVGNMTYEKKWVHGTADATIGGSLKKLLYLQEVSAGDRT